MGDEAGIVGQRRQARRAHRGLRLDLRVGGEGRAVLDRLRQAEGGGRHHLDRAAGEQLL
jgi:hypothetical protein